MEERIGSTTVRLGLALGVLALAWAAALAHAQPARDRVVLAIDQGVEGDLTMVVRAEIALRGLDLDVVPAPAGADVTEREAVARLLAQERRAVATLWIENEQSEVRATTPAGPVAFAALPRPLREVTPRVLAVVAASVLDDALAPPPVPAAPSAPTTLATTSPPPVVATPPADPETGTPTVVVVPIVVTTVATPPPVVASEASARAPDPEATPTDPTPEAPSADTDADARGLRLEGIVDTFVGIVWSFGERTTSNVAQLAARGGIGFLDPHGLRIEVVAGGGLEYGIDGSYLLGFLLELDGAVAAEIDAGDLSWQLGGSFGLAVHDLLDARTDGANVTPAVRFGGIAGLETAAAPGTAFRARLELGTFVREGPLPVQPYVAVTVGVAIR